MRNIIIALLALLAFCFVINPIVGYIMSTVEIVAGVNQNAL